MIYSILVTLVIGYIIAGMAAALFLPRLEKELKYDNPFMMGLLWPIFVFIVLPYYWLDRKIDELEERREKKSNS